MNRTPPTIDMLPDGTFRTAPRPLGLSFATKLALGSMLVAVLGVAMAVAALAIWLVSMLLPAIVLAAAVCWGALKWRRWQMRGTLRPRPPGFYRP